MSHISNGCTESVSYTHLDVYKRQIHGWGDAWDSTHFEHDDYAQLPLMKQRRNRVAYYKNECEFGWLRNATRKEFSSANFALVTSGGNPTCGGASDTYGVRPEFWLEK